MGALVMMVTAPVCMASTLQWGCSNLNYCSGHGLCKRMTPSSPLGTCECQSGWGAESDVATDRAIDCSLRTCPTGRAYGDLPTGTKRAHAPAECSNNGLCNRLDGFCMCYAGFVGFACQRRTCPSECSGHGQCKSMQELAAKSDALPLSNVTKYYGKLETTTWDVGTSYGCFCDSGWSVGLGDGETQTPEWFGPDCSERHCPSGDDPNTDADETDCFGVVAAGGRGIGKQGNLCHVECSNHGTCSYKSGECECFAGYKGVACSKRTFE